MHRREAITTLAGIFGATVALPAWANAWHPASLNEPSLLGREQKRLLLDLTEAIIPKTSTPGAADLSVPQFVELMIQDCADEKGKKQLETGLLKLEEESKKQAGGGFSKLSTSQRLALLKDWSDRKDSEEQSFIHTIKNLTIQGYQSSEYYMTNVSRYELVPARYHGCVDVES